MKIRRRKRKGPLPFRYVLLLSFVFFVLSTAFGLWIVNTGVEPTLMSYAESKTRKLSSEVINQAIKKKTINIEDINNVLDITYDDNKSVTAVNFKTKVINRILADTVSEIQKNIRSVEKSDLSSLEEIADVEIEKNPSKKSEGMVWYVPLGRATNSALLGNLGPKIPVKFNAIGDIQPDIKTNIKSMGINNTWIEVSLKLVVSMQIITPFATKITKLTQNIPVAQGFIQGEVPQYFNGGSGTTPAIQLPNNKKD